jgi:hypothetical protein
MGCAAVVVMPSDSEQKREEEAWAAHLMRSRECSKRAARHVQALRRRMALAAGADPATISEVDWASVPEPPPPYPVPQRVRHAPTERAPTAEAVSRALRTVQFATVDVCGIVVEYAVPPRTSPPLVAPRCVL